MITSYGVYAMETILMSKSEQKRLAVMAQMTSGKLNLIGEANYWV
jgi:hypothetical protein